VKNATTDETGLKETTVNLVNSDKEVTSSKVVNSVMENDQHPDLMVKEAVVAVVEWAVDVAEAVVLDLTDVKSEETIMD